MTTKDSHIQWNPVTTSQPLTFYCQEYKPYTTNLSISIFSLFLSDSHSVSFFCLTLALSLCQGVSVTGRWQTHTHTKCDSWPVCERDICLLKKIPEWETGRKIGKERERDHVEDLSIRVQHSELPDAPERITNELLQHDEKHRPKSINWQCWKCQTKLMTYHLIIL